jgi:hypothetical protein
MNFIMDLSDLAHYFRQRQRLIDGALACRAVLPPGFILDAPHADLVTDHADWTFEVLAFLGLKWDRRRVGSAVLGVS